MESDDLVRRNREYDEKLESLGIDPVNPIQVTIDRQRKITRRLTIQAWVLTFALVGVGWLAWRANTAELKATRAQSALVQSCESSNQARAVELSVWNYVLGLPPSAPETAQQLAQIRQFKTFLDATLSPRDCTRIVR